MTDYDRLITLLLIKGDYTMFRRILANILVDLFVNLVVKLVLAVILA